MKWKECKPGVLICHESRVGENKEENYSDGDASSIDYTSALSTDAINAIVGAINNKL
jgi:hypothetical protein